MALYLLDDGDNPADVPVGWRVFMVRPDWRAHLTRCSGAVWRVDRNLTLLENRQISAFAQGEIFDEEMESFAHSITTAMAPVLFISNVFERDFCRLLIEHFQRDCGGGEASGVLIMEHGTTRYELDPSIKQRRESFVRDAELEARMHERVLRRALPEIERAYQFRATSRDPFKLLAYPAGAGYFNAHRDNETPDVAHRKFALSVNLNHGEYTGGEFRYPEFGPHRYSPSTGTAIVFSCSLLHELTPIESGERFATTVFLA